MTLKEKIIADFKKALKGKNTTRVGVLRLLLNALQQKEITLRGQDGAEQLDEKTMIAVLRGELKKGQEAAQQYRAGQRLELAQKEEQEAEIIVGYLPPSLTANEIKKIVQGVIEKMNVQSAKQFGPVMGAVNKEIAGRAEGALVAQIVKEELAGF